MLTHDEFKNLCLAAGYLIGAPDPAAFAETGELADDEVYLGLYPDDDSTQSVSCYADLGAVAPERRAEVFEDMLAMNAVVGRRSEGMLCFDRESGHAVVTTRIQAECLMGPQDLADHIQQLKALTSAIRSRLGADDASLGPRIASNLLA